MNISQYNYAQQTYKMTAPASDHHHLRSYHMSFDPATEWMWPVDDRGIMPRNKLNHLYLTRDPKYVAHIEKELNVTPPQTRENHFQTGFVESSMGYVYYYLHSTGCGRPYGITYERTHYSKLEKIYFNNGDGTKRLAIRCVV